MARHEYSTDVEGGTPVQVRYAITGRIDPATYLPFVLNRARWLDIHGWASAEEGAATVVAAGPEALVGALEIQVVRWAVWNEIEVTELRDQLRASARAVLRMEAP